MKSSRSRLALFLPLVAMMQSRSFASGVILTDIMTRFSLTGAGFLPAPGRFPPLLIAMY